MKSVKHMQLHPGMTVGKLVEEMSACGVLGAGRIGEAVNLAAEMFGNPDYTVFLTIAGALIPGGFRNIIAELIKKEYVNVVVTTGANLVHDMVEALGHKHFKGSFLVEDSDLKARNVGRIGDIYIEQEAFEHLEKWLYIVLNDIPKAKRQSLSLTELLFEIGKHINDPQSILALATQRRIPVICPAFMDSIAGFHLWIYGQDKKIKLDFLQDTKILVDKVYEAKRAGIIILGGGQPKHFALFANTFRGGVDSAIQITMDRPEPGGLSGASLEEAISWGKIKPKAKMVNVICDVTIAFPIIVCAALEKLRKPFFE